MGLGVVGSGVAATLLDQSEAIARKIGYPVTLKKVLVRDLDKPRDATIPKGMITTNPEEILADPSIQIVVEVIG